MAATYGYRYQQDRAALLEQGLPCWMCGAEANSADHFPPLSEHVIEHEHGTGCCELLPACLPCQRKQGGEAALRVAKQGPKRKAVAVWGSPLCGPQADDPRWQVPWLKDLLDDMPASATFPRFATLPFAQTIGSWGSEFEDWLEESRADVTGRPIRMRWWQRFVIRLLLQYEDVPDEDGELFRRPCASEVLMSCARQSGKSTLLRELITWKLQRPDLFGSDQTALLMARDLPVCWEIQRPVRRWAKDQDGWHSAESNGKELVEHLASGNRWLLKSTGTVYGATAGLGAFCDEVWDLDAATVEEGIEPTLAEIPTSQILLTSTAHRRATSLFPSRRRSAIDDLELGEKRRVLIEWSAHVEPGSEPVLGDLTAWRQASPHWSDSRRETIQARYEAMLRGEAENVTGEPPESAFVTQWLNAWSDHGTRVREKGDPLFDMTDWADLLRVVGPVDSAVMAVEDWGGRGASVGWCGLADDGRPVVGAMCFDTRSEAYSFVQSHIDDVSVLVAGATLGADPDLRSMTTNVRLAGWADTRAGLPRLREAVASGRIWQDGSPALSEQLGEARVKVSPSGMSLLGDSRSDAMRCMVWALQHHDAQQVAGLGIT